MFLKIWRDPVWSKVISVGIIAILGAVFVYVKSLIDQQAFLVSLSVIAKTKIDLWIVFLILVVGVVAFFLFLKRSKRDKSSVKIKPTYTEAQIEHDKRLFEELKSKMPTNGSIQFIRENNFAGFSFFWKDLNDFDYVMENISNPDVRFIDEQIEKIRKEVFDEIKKYRYYLATKAFTIEVNDSGRRASVPPEWEHQQPEMFSEVVNTLHDVAGKICDLYDELISKGKHLYGI